MKENFSEYYRPTEEDFKHLWENCEFVFDANVLLNIYRYSPDTTKELFDILEKIKDRIWLPHQAALEYQTNRFAVIEEQVEKCTELENLLKTNDILKYLNSNKRHPFINTEAVESKLIDIFEELKNEIQTNRENYPNTIQNDNLRDKITNLFSGKIGNECSNLEDTYKEGKKRFSDKIPPGFEDNNKQGNQKYGDYIIWKQIIDYAKSIQKPIILVTDDSKKDWWLINKKKKIISPHPFLIREMKNEANCGFYIYNSKTFMGHVQNYLGYNVNKPSIREIEKVQHDIISEKLGQIQITFKKKHPDIDYWTQKIKNAEDAVKEAENEYLLAQDEYCEAEVDLEAAELRAEGAEYWEMEIATSEVEDAKQNIEDKEFWKDQAENGLEFAKIELQEVRNEMEQFKKDFFLKNKAYKFDKYT